jgi:hypothetical protein
VVDRTVDVMAGGVAAVVVGIFGRCGVFDVVSVSGDGGGSVVMPAGTDRPVVAVATAWAAVVTGVVGGLVGAVGAAVQADMVTAAAQITSHAPICHLRATFRLIGWFVMASQSLGMVGDCRPVPRWCDH